VDNAEIDFAGTYSAAMDSVNILKAGKPSYYSADEWADCVQRNVDHLKIIRAIRWPKTFDLAPIDAAIKSE
jgi:hypothetical protein